MNIFLIFIIFVVVIVIYGVITFNKCVKKRNLVKEAWSGIDVQLKRRHNLIPNIVETVKGYSKHEKELLEDIAYVRTNAEKAETVRQRGDEEGKLSHSLRNLFALAESYPELKANENFLALQQSLTEIEEQISMARRYYNGTVRNINILVESFPSSIVANMSGFARQDFFEIEYAAHREAPEVQMS